VKIGRKGVRNGETIGNRDVKIGVPATANQPLLTAQLATNSSEHNRPECRNGSDLGIATCSRS